MTVRKWNKNTNKFPGDTHSHRHPHTYAHTHKHTTKHTLGQENPTQTCFIKQDS